MANETGRRDWAASGREGGARPAVFPAARAADATMTAVAVVIAGAGGDGGGGGGGGGGGAECGYP